MKLSATPGKKYPARLHINGAIYSAKVVLIESVTETRRLNKLQSKTVNRWLEVLEPDCCLTFSDHAEDGRHYEENKNVWLTLLGASYEWESAS